MTKKQRKSRLRRKAARATRAPAPSAQGDPLDDFIAAGSSALDLKIAEAWRPAVREHLRIVLQHGARVEQFDLPDDSEPAPVFEA